MVAYVNRKIAVFCVLLLVFVGTATVVNAQATDLHDAATQLTKKLNDDPDVQKINGEHIVIAPFENINGKGDAVPRILQEMLTTSFIKAKHFKVLERDQLRSALDELHFQLSDLADPAKAKKIGKLAGATYVLLGSISDTGGTTSINARIVSIESGESVAAEDVDIKTADATSGVGGLNPSSNPATTTATSDTPQPATIAKPGTAAIDLNAKATSISAGQYIGQKNNFGLLGGTKFQIAWRESLGQQRVYSFSAGDLLGDGTKRLAIFTQNSVGDACVRVLKWDKNSFSQTWESERIMLSANSCLRVSQEPRQPATISLSIYGITATTIANSGLPDFDIYAWRWNRTTFAHQSREQFKSLVVDWLPDKPSIYLGIGFSKYLNVNNLTDGTSKAVNVQLKDFNAAIAIADMDGDGNLEIAKIEPDAQPIEVYSLTGLRKAVTIKSYDSYSCLAIWNPTAFKFPFLVASKNTFDSDGKPNGGYVYFIQWNGESYEEVWKSNQLDDAVIDMQVCDPKGEGKPGLVILSTDKKGYYLTKIVHVN